MLDMVIDITRLLARGLQGRLPTGVDRVSLEYLRHFGSSAKGLVRIAGRWVVLSGADSKRIFDELLSPSLNFGRVIRLRLSRAYVMSWSTKTRRILLNTGHSGLDQPDYALQVRRRGMLPVFFLHDLIPLTHPEYCRAGESKKHLQRLSTMVLEGGGLIVNSMDTLRALERFASQQAWAMPPSAVAHLAPATLPAPTSHRPMAEPYFVMLGTIEPRKNHLLLLHVWRQLIEKLGVNAPHLVIVGQRGWECEQVVDMLERCSALKSHVVEKRACNDAELANWLSHSQALLFPSFVEGFGMPMVEALMLGVPVVASDLPVFREIVGSIPDYLDPMDGVGWRRLIVEYANSQSQVRKDQLVRMHGFQAPTWSAHFEVVAALLERVASLKDVV